MNQFRQQRGIILVFGLGIMATLMAVALVFSSLIFSDLKKARLAGNAMAAYYAAEAGLESSLFLLRKESNTQNIDDIASLKSLNNAGLLAASASAWSIDDSIDAESAVFRSRLKNGQGVKLYFLGRDDSPRTNPAQSFTVEWIRTPGSSARLQVSAVQLTPQISAGELVVNYADLNDLIFDDTSTRGSAQCFEFQDLALDGTQLTADYLVEFKVLGVSGDSLDYLLVKSYDATCAAMDENSVPNGTAITNLTIRSVGVKNGARQEIVAHLPPKTVASGLLNFVLFSEEDITKDY